VVTFKARSTGKLRARIANNALPQLRFGSLRIEIQAGSRTRPRGCRRPKRSGSARVAAACTWVVNFAVVQDGFPSYVLRHPYEDLIGTETTVAGKMFFSEKPTKNIRSRGSVAAVAFHSDQFLTPALTTQEAAVALKPSHAGEYIYGPREKKILVQFEVQSRTLSPGTAQPIDAIRDEVTILLEDVTGASDRLVWQSFTPHPSTHRHIWDNSNRPSNRVQVEVGLPKPL
jgi:hypothetical protein